MKFEKQVEDVTRQLMAVHKHSVQYSAEVTDEIGDGTLCWNQDIRYLVPKAALDAIDRAISKVRNLVDGYTEAALRTDFQHIALSLRGQSVAREELFSRMRNKVGGYLAQFQAAPRWKVIVPVKGLAVDQFPFELGQCVFSVIDAGLIACWEGVGLPDDRNAFSQYSPSSGLNSRSAHLIGHTAATVELTAINQSHAYAKAELRIQRALDAFRLIQLVYTNGRLGEEFYATIGVGRQSHMWTSALAICLDRPAPGTSESWSSAYQVRTAQLDSLPGWKHLCQVLIRQASELSEIEQRITNALQWVGQAAIARSSGVKLVLLVTAMEAILIDQGEAKGKRKWLTSRIRALFELCSYQFIRGDVVALVDLLYGTRSACVHGGSIKVAHAILDHAISFVLGIVACVLQVMADHRICDIGKLSEFLEINCPLLLIGEKRTWVSERAYFLWIEAGCPSGFDIQHWTAAESEYSSMS